MTDQHPITPPPELVQQWREETCPFFHLGGINDLATQAARWGADQELQACVNWLDDTDCEDPQEVAQRLRAARRPKPPSLKEQALHAANLLFDHSEIGECALAQATIRKALEALPND
jgi:hypothetical protein